MREKIQEWMGVWTEKLQTAQELKEMKVEIFDTWLNKQLEGKKLTSEEMADIKAIVMTWLDITDDIESGWLESILLSTWLLKVIRWIKSLWLIFWDSLKKDLNEKYKTKQWLHINSLVKESRVMREKIIIMNTQEALAELKNEIEPPTQEPIVAPPIVAGTEVAPETWQNAREKRNDTTLWDELWAELTKEWPIDTWKNSCGRAVRELLGRFGIEWLPLTGADGYKWDDGDFLWKTNWLTYCGNPMRFIKVEITSPYDALPGAIINYEKGVGTGKRREFGHVEIVGEDGQFYYYKKTDKSGWSLTRTKEQIHANPQQFKKATAFTGYAFYPVLE